MGDHQHQQIQHFSHHHPLMFKEELDQSKNDIIGHPPVFCDGCEDQVLGPSYSCHQCPNKLFILHKSCAELPCEIQHPIHSKHPLVLLLTSSTQGSRGQNNIHCDACQQDCIGSFIYHCSQCDFNLDLKCASNWRNIVEYSSHDHIFTVLNKPQYLHHPFTCDVCGEKGNCDKDGTMAESLYMCSICQLLVHKKCCWLPSHVKIATHKHPLKLTWRFEDIYPKGDLHLCQICLRSMDKSCAVYYCHEKAGCSYVVHNTCGISLFSQKPPETTPAPAPAPSPPPAPATDEHINNKTQQLEEELPKTIQHCCHDHLLYLTNLSDYYDNDDDDRNITCDGCMLPIAVTDAYFYTCTDKRCHFLLHKTCAQLPSDWGGFKLIPRPHGSIDGLFVCKMCQTKSQGLAYYRIYSGDVYVDIQCLRLFEASYLEGLQHVAHDHRLKLTHINTNKKCSGCGNTYKSDVDFRWHSCVTCNFHMCFQCLKLPSTARHRYHTHPLKLTYDTVTNQEVDDDDDDQYYCEICEGKRDPTLWSYSCTDCDFHCHPHCLLGTYPQVKLGGAYKLKSHPQHLVTLVEKRRSPIPNDKRENILPCEVCHKPCLGLVFECSICNINVHHDC